MFSSNEQHYYYSKASHAKDYKAQVEIMANDDPVQIKRIGKRIRVDNALYMEREQ